MSDYRAHAEKANTSGNSRPSIAGQRKAWRFAVVALPSLFLWTLWVAGWFDAASSTLFVSASLIGARLGSRIAAGASRLWAIALGFGAAGAYLLLFICADWMMGVERTASDLPLSYLAFSGAVGAFFSFIALWAARSERRRMAQAKAASDRSAQAHDTPN